MCRCYDDTANESLRLVGGSLSSHHDFLPLPMSSRDLLVAPSASTLTSHHHQRVMRTCWWLSRPPSALPPLPTSPQNSLVASSASICPSTTANESVTLVGGFLGLHLPFHPHQRVVVPLASTSTSHLHQRVMTTHWWFPQSPPQLPTPTNES